MLFHRIGHGAQNLGAARAAQCVPGGLRRLGGGEGLGDVGRRGLGDRVTCALQMR